jgi:hypothetical protein
VPRDHQILPRRHDPDLAAAARQACRAAVRRVARGVEVHAQVPEPVADLRVHRRGPLADAARERERVEAALRGSRSSGLSRR